MKDCKIKGRHASNQSETKYANGTRQGLAKLNDQKVMTILFIGDMLPQRRVAEIFGVSKNTIKLILQRKTWRHI